MVRFPVHDSVRVGVRSSAAATHPVVAAPSTAADGPARGSATAWEEAVAARREPLAAASTRVEGGPGARGDLGLQGVAAAGRQGEGAVQPGVVLALAVEPAAHSGRVVVAWTHPERPRRPR